MDANHWLTVVVLTIVLIFEGIGGYFAMRPHIKVALGPSDVFMFLRIRGWMKFWARFGIPRADVGEEYRRFYIWHPAISSAEWLLARGIVRLTAAAIFLVRYAVWQVPPWHP